MPTRSDNFVVRASRRRYENRGKSCPQCGLSDTLLLTRDGRCASCASHHKEESHHLLGNGFRSTKEDDDLTLPLSPNAHRLVSDLQADNPPPDAADPTSRAFFNGVMVELLISIADVLLVLRYLREQPDIMDTLPWLMLVPLAGLFLVNLDRIDLPGLLARAKEMCRARAMEAA